MASHALASMLDELMGRNRNLAPTEKGPDPKWDDGEVCRYYLVDFCPHEMFVNTRADLGQCDKIHDDHLKKEYQGSTRVGKMGYEHEFLRYLQGLINDVEKRIRRGHVRLALNTDRGGSMNGNPASQREEKISMLTEKINDLVQQAEELGCKGKVEEAQGIMKLCDQFNDERTHLQNTPAQDNFNEPMKAMEVCIICGALLVVGDAQQRVDEHIMGKQHSGYARIRAYVEGKRLKAQSEEEERETRLRLDREERESLREKEREERKKAEEEKQAEREKEREERKKEREDRKEKEKEKEERRRRSRSRSRRSRSRDRKHRSRSRSRHRHRSRSRSHDRHRSKRSRRSHSHTRRSRSHDRHRHSRSHDKDHSSGKSSKERSESKDKESEKVGEKAGRDAAPPMDQVTEEPPTTTDQEEVKTEGDTN